jgi:tetratricopeptide (TPR) repeat protein
MGKNKHKKGVVHRKSISSIAPAESTDSIIELAKKYIQKEKARDAIAVLKQAEKAKGDPHTVGLLQYQAYLLREKQLRGKGLTNEADMVRKLAFDSLPGVENLSESDFMGYISRIDASKAVTAYLDYTRHHPASVTLMQQLAYKMMMTQQWDKLNLLEPDHPLCMDASTVAEAVLHMNQGDWEAALKRLKSVSRSSPYSPIRVFCRAMTLFYQENDTEMQQILYSIPDNFPLPHVIEGLIACCDSDDHSRNPRIRCLWDGPLGLENQISNLITDFRRNQFNRLVDAIPRLARVIYPPEPDMAVFHILELVGLDRSHSRSFMMLAKKLMERLLKPEQITLWLIKTAFLMGQSTLKTTFDYMDLVSKLFSSPDDRNMAYGLILLNAVKTMEITRLSKLQYERDMLSCPDILTFETMPENVEALKNALLIRSIELDPTHRAAYELLCILHQKNRELTRQVETVLNNMALIFPDDPFPFLELAACHYTKNAFRKAEKALEEASLRAPHDSRVIDRRVMALLIAAERNIRRAKLHLAVPDMDKAEELDSKRIRPILIEKKILFSMIQDKSAFGKVMKHEFLALSNIERIRILNLLDIDIEKNPISSGRSFQKMIEAEIKTTISQIHELLPTDLESLIAPFPQEFYPILPSVNLGETFLANYHQIFDKISNQNLIPACIQIWRFEVLPVIERELNKRLKVRDQPFAVQIRFFLEILAHMTGQRYGSHGFLMVLEGCDDRLTDELKSLAKNMVRHTSGNLKLALERFDFSILNRIAFNEFEPDEDDWEEDEDDWDDDEDEAALLDSMIRVIENMIDESEMRGQPNRIIRKLHKRMMSDMKQNQDTDFDEMRQMIQDMKPRNISREAQILLFDKIII